MIAKQLVVGPKMAEGNIGLLVQVAGQYKSELHLQMENKKINLKSIMGVISIGRLTGNEVTISANGNDEEAAVDAVSDFLCK
jgi:phosphotransferase system HPr (HPr) family protein